MQKVYFMVEEINAIMTKKEKPDELQINGCRNDFNQPVQMQGSGYCNALLYFTDTCHFFTKTKLRLLKDILLLDKFYFCFK